MTGGVETPRMHCFVYRLLPGAGTEYDARHEQVWPELLDLISSVGVFDYHIFRRGELVISVLRCREDFAVARVRLAASDVQRRWSESLKDLFMETMDHDGEPLWANEVFRLQE